MNQVFVIVLVNLLLINIDSSRIHHLITTPEPKKIEPISSETTKKHHVKGAILVAVAGGANAIVTEFSIAENYKYNCFDHTIYISFELSMKNGSTIQAFGFLKERSIIMTEHQILKSTCKNIKKYIF
jgi:hypothetical protein